MSTYEVRTYDGHYNLMCVSDLILKDFLEDQQIIQYIDQEHQIDIIFSDGTRISLLKSQIKLYVFTKTDNPIMHRNLNSNVRGI